MSRLWSVLVWKLLPSTWYRNLRMDIDSIDSKECKVEMDNSSVHSARGLCYRNLGCCMWSTSCSTTPEMATEWASVVRAKEALTSGWASMADMAKRFWALLKETFAAGDQATVLSSEVHLPHSAYVVRWPLIVWMNLQCYPIRPRHFQVMGQRNHLM